jgi:hypothetical protein
MVPHEKRATATSLQPTSEFLRGMLAETALSARKPVVQDFMVDTLLVPCAPHLANMAIVLPTLVRRENLTSFNSRWSGNRHQPENGKPNDSDSTAMENAACLAHILWICLANALDPYADSIANRGAQGSHACRDRTITLGCKVGDGATNSYRSFRS